MEEQSIKNEKVLFDDKELDEISNNLIEIDEKFEKEMSKKIDKYLKENPFEYEDSAQKK